MTAMEIHPEHRVSAAVDTAREALAAVAGERPWSMTAPQTDAALAGVEVLEAALPASPPPRP